MLLFGIGIPAVVGLGIVFMLADQATGAYVLFAVAAVDALWLLRVLRG